MFGKKNNVTIDEIRKAAAAVAANPGTPAQISALYQFNTLVFQRVLGATITKTDDAIVIKFGEKPISMDELLEIKVVTDFVSTLNFGEKAADDDDTPIPGITNIPLVSLIPTKLKAADAREEIKRDLCSILVGDAVLQLYSLGEHLYKRENVKKLVITVGVVAVAAVGAGVVMWLLNSDADESKPADVDVDPDVPEMETVDIDYDDVPEVEAEDIG